jgi:hypothetical protein
VAHSQPEAVHLVSLAEALSERVVPGGEGRGRALTVASGAGPVALPGEGGGRGWRERGGVGGVRG